MSQLERGSPVAHQACACPYQQRAHPSPRTGEPLGSVVETGTWLPSGGRPFEEILMPGLAESPQQFGMHCCSLRIERRRILHEGCDNGLRDPRGWPGGRRRRRRRSPVSSMPVSPAERGYQRQRRRTASASDRWSSGYSCAPPQCSRWSRHENTPSRKWRAFRTRTQRTCAAFGRGAAQTISTTGTIIGRRLVRSPTNRPRARRVCRLRASMSCAPSRSAWVTPAATTSLASPRSSSASGA